MRLTWAERARIGGAAAALLLAALSRGDALALAVVLAVCVWSPAGAVASAAALGATSWRWGSSALEAWAGGQAVLGPAGWLEPRSAAAAAWLAGAALVLSAPAPGLRTVTDVLVGGGRVATVESPRRTLATTLAALALGAAAADVVAGPSAGERWWVRGVATAAGMVVALGAQVLRRARPRLVDVAAVACAAGAVACTVPRAPGWSGTLDGSALRGGLTLAVAVIAASAVGGRVLVAMRHLRP